MFSRYKQNLHRFRKIWGKSLVQLSPSRQARRRPLKMHNVAAHENLKQSVNTERPTNPPGLWPAQAASHGDNAPKLDHISAIFAHFRVCVWRVANSWGTICMYVHKGNFVIQAFDIVNRIATHHNRISVESSLQIWGIPLNVFLWTLVPI